MKFFRCDRCGKQAEPKEQNESFYDYIENWEVVKISGLPPIDICEQCARALFELLSPPTVESTKPDSNATPTEAKP